jgi:hypothetical protein
MGGDRRRRWTPRPSRVLSAALGEGEQADVWAATPSKWHPTPFCREHLRSNATAPGGAEPAGGDSRRTLVEPSRPDRARGRPSGVRLHLLPGWVAGRRAPGSPRQRTTPPRGPTDWRRDPSDPTMAGGGLLGPRSSHPRRRPPHRSPARPSARSGPLRRSPADEPRIRELLAQLGRAAKSPVRAYLVGGATAVLQAGAPTSCPSSTAGGTAAATWGPGGRSWCWSSRRASGRCSLDSRRRFDGEVAASALLLGAPVWWLTGWLGAAAAGVLLAVVGRRLPPGAPALPTDDVPAD